jgi:hypothetical protein
MVSIAIWIDYNAFVLLEELRVQNNLKPFSTIHFPNHKTEEVPILFVTRLSIVSKSY